MGFPHLASACTSICTVTRLLQGCIRSNDLSTGRRVHSHIINNGLDLASDVSNFLIQVFASPRSLLEANLIFCRIAKPTSDMWQAIISAHASAGETHAVLCLFYRMQQHDVEPAKAPFLYALKAISQIKQLLQGRIMHAQVLESGLEIDVAVGSTLVDMYAKCESLGEAHNVFEKMPNRNVVSWNAMIAGYIKQQQEDNAFKLFDKMQQGGVHPSRFTFSCILKACNCIEQGKLIHDLVISSSFESDLVIGTALIDMYVKCGGLEQAHGVFDKLVNRDLIAWNAIIAGYTQHGEGFPAVKLFEKMKQAGFRPDKMTFSSIVKACGSIGAVEKGRVLHEEITAINLDPDVIVANSLIDMYAKCGHLLEAHKVLDSMPNQDLVSWNIMLARYAQHGDSRMIKHCLNAMKEAGLKPDERTFLSILAACSHAGHITEGYEYFASMAASHGIAGNDEHFNCIIDLLGRAGCLKEAGVFIESMPSAPTITTWTSLLSACSEYTNMDVAMQCFDQALVLDPDCGTGYSLMSNVCAGADVQFDASSYKITTNL